MINSGKFASLSAAAVLFTVLAATSASAVTVVSNGGIYDTGLGLETKFIGDVKDSSGGAGSYSITFNSTGDASAVAQVTIGPLVSSTFADLTMSWVDGKSANSTPIVPVTTTRDTVFSAPDFLSQSLMFSWTDSLINAGFEFEVAVTPVLLPEVTPVPLPAAGLMLLAAIGGLGAIRNRRKGAVRLMRTSLSSPAISIC